MEPVYFAHAEDNFCPLSKFSPQLYLAHCPPTDLVGILDNRCEKLFDLLEQLLSHVDLIY